MQKILMLLICMLGGLFFVADLGVTLASDTTIEKEMFALQPKLEKYVMGKSSEEIDMLVITLSNRLPTIQSSWKKMLGESIIEYIKLIQSKRISKNIKASSGDSVSVNYSLYVMSGDIRLIYDTSIESLAKKGDIWNQSRMYEPLTFTIGQQQMIPGFEAGVVNMYLGEKKTITVFAKDGYGEKDLKLIKHVEKTVFTDAGIEPKVGESYNIGSFPGKVLTIEDSSVTIDFNHYLAGKTLYFDVELKSVDKK